MSAQKKTEESAIIRKVQWAAARGRRDAKLAGIVLGIGDDAAVWRPRPRFETILTTDWFLDGTHFWRDWHPPEAIGWKSVMRAASDIAAMGGLPRCFLLSLALPSALSGTWLDQFLRGITRASAKLRCPLAGGDTTKAGRVLINVTVVGEVPRGRALLRSRAKPGDLIYVTGRLGEAELGLRLARKLRRSGKRAEDDLLLKHLFPEARNALGYWLRHTVRASAAMDLSDGLSLDLHRVCAASEVGAVIHSEKLPMASPEFLRAFSDLECQDAALHGGDDYELLFCLPSKYRGRIPPSKMGIRLNQIGEITDSPRVSIVSGNGRRIELLPRGWDPFD